MNTPVLMVGSKRKAQQKRMSIRICGTLKQNASTKLRYVVAQIPVHGQNTQNGIMLIDG
jgi:hypothetical protein